jgi:glycosyltransferase involved in cell wall biosynthesis
MADLAPGQRPLRVGFVLHVMQVAGAEMLVADTIMRIGSGLEPVVFCLDSVGQLGERMIARGIPVIAYGRKTGMDFSVSKRMAKDIKARQLEVLHAHQYTPFFYGSIAARLSGVSPKVIFTEHGRHYPDVVSSKRRWANRLVFDRLADDVNAVCEFSARSLSERDGFRASRIHVIENGIDIERYRPGRNQAELKAALGLDPSRRYIACIARFHPVKDHRTLIRAFSDVARALGDVDLLLVGDGQLRGELEAEVTALQLTGRVRFLGVRDDVAEILQASDVFALTSVSEAASITLLEAMAAARPVVVTAVGGNPEIVRQDQDGLLAPRGDAPAIAEALIGVLKDSALAARLGASGAARVRQTYQLQQTIERYHALYRTLAAARRAA